MKKTPRSTRDGVMWHSGHCVGRSKVCALRVPFPEAFIAVLECVAAFELSASDLPALVAVPGTYSRRHCYDMHPVTYYHVDVADWPSENHVWVSRVTVQCPVLLNQNHPSLIGAMASSSLALSLSFSLQVSRAAWNCPIEHNDWMTIFFLSLILHVKWNSSSRSSARHEYELKSS